MKTIKKIVMSNFKRFKRLELEFDDKLNILIGDNEAGKSSVLLALDLVLSGSRSKIETMGLETLFNNEVVSAFLAGAKKFGELPTLFVEIYLSEQDNPYLNGKNHSSGIVACDGLRLTCEPIDDYSKEISEVLNEDHPNFPFEYYAIKFTTFAGELYSGFKKPLKHLVIDSSQINSDYATREYTKSIYGASATVLERNRNEYLYRKSKAEFKKGALADLNKKLDSYKFSVKTNPKSNLETDLVITENDIPIESKGKGRQCFIKTEFALSKNEDEHSLDILLLEEPENHLSHTNMKMLIQRMAESASKQLFIATHNSLICTRLDLRKAILLSASAKPAALKDLPEDTAKFFIKAPDNNVLEFVLSRKVILVEGDAEFILFDALYKKQLGNSTLEKDGVHVISVGGTSFKRYLDLAKLLGIKTVVVRDNDGDYQKNCIDAYAGYANGLMRVFSDKDPAMRTFEICFYKENKVACDDLFQAGRVTLSVEDFMLKNKADAAFELLDKKEAELVAPTYIQEAIAWIKE